MKSLILLLALAAPLSAATNRVMTVKVPVDGMVCSFCAQGIIAHFKKHAAVSNVQVDLTRKLVILEEKKGAAISDGEITDYIRKSGFEPKKVERVTDSFDSVKKAKK